MKALLKAYGFNSDMQYFERIVLMTKHNDKPAMKVMFTDMPRKIRKNFVVAIYSGTWNNGLTDQQKAFFMNLL
jgi:hypothetical protein